jgi:hypothetical protein
MLTLDVPCYFRQVSKKDRSFIEYSDNKRSLEKMKWLVVPAGRDIVWRPISLQDKEGATAPVSSFEIAVIKGGKAVVFRNQNLFVGDTKEQVKQQCRTYIANVLRLPGGNLAEMVKITPSDRQFSGALSYSYLAELLLEDNHSKAVEVQPLAGFMEEMQSENQSIAKALGG